MLADRRIRALVDYPDARDVFAGVDIAGGVSYFLWDLSWEGKCEVTTVSGGVVGPILSRHLSDYDILVRYNEAIPILERVFRSSERGAFDSLASQVSPMQPFSVRTSFRGNPSSDGMDDPVLEKAMGWSSKAIGERAFCRQVELDLKAQVGQLGAPQDAAMRRMEAGTPPEVVEAAVCSVFRVALADLVGRRKKSDARSMLMKLLVHCSGMTQREVAQRLGLIDGSGVSRAIAELSRNLLRDRKLDRLYHRLEKRIAKH